MSFGQRNLDRQKPEIEFPENGAPTELVVKDLIEGHGVQGQVIRGWDEGLIGMKAGGRRRLEIPADMAYGDRGAGSAIAPGESLIFVVDLLEVR